MDDAAPWVRLRPTVRLFAFGLMCVPLAVLCTVLPLVAFFAEDLGSRIGFLTLGPVLAPPAWFAVYGIFAVRTRFQCRADRAARSDAQSCAALGDVREIKTSVFGAHVATTREPLIVWKYFRGYQQFIAEAARQGVEIDPALLPERAGARRRIAGDPARRRNPASLFEARSLHVPYTAVPNSAARPYTTARYDLRCETLPARAAHGAGPRRCKAGSPWQRAARSRRLWHGRLPLPPWAASSRSWR